LFSKAVSEAARISRTSAVDKLRDASNEIINEILSNSGIFAIHGLRGTGKTTLLSSLNAKLDKSLYMDASILVKYDIDLLEFLEYAETKGYNVFLLDEIHTYPGWPNNIKIFYDETHSKIVVTGSSAINLKISASELSRRVRTFELKPLSFREYIFLRTGDRLPKMTLEEIIKSPTTRIAKMIGQYVSLYEPYVQSDALPAAFYSNNPDIYWNILDRVIRYDLASLREIDEYYISLAYRVIKFVATSDPGEFSYTKLASSLGCGIKLARDIVEKLSETGILRIIPPHGKGHRAIRSEDKVLMSLSYRYAMCTKYNVKPSIGGIREDFFIQHVGDAMYLKTGVKRRTPDYVVNGKVFEVGGPSKGKSQLGRNSDHYVVKETLLPSKGEVSLYSIGLLY